MIYGPVGDIDIPNSSIDNRDIIVLKSFWKRVKLTAHYPLFREMNVMLKIKILKRIINYKEGIR